MPAINTQRKAVTFYRVQDLVNDFLLAGDVDHFWDHLADGDAAFGGGQVHTLVGRDWLLQEVIGMEDEVYVAPLKNALLDLPEKTLFDLE